ncbi:MAG: transcriptional repressor [Ginsengibacter sp.]
MNKELENMLIAKQISPTAMRLLVFEFLLKQTTANSLADLEKEFHHSDRTTLYRTLKTFEEKGLIHNIQDGTGATKYALCADECKEGLHHDLHVHFYCTHCKETFCLPRNKIPVIQLPNGFNSHEFNLIAKGICDKCSRETMQ